MILKDFKPGDRVLIYVDKNNNLIHYTDTSSKTLPCTVIINNSNEIIIGWTKDDDVPNSIAGSTINWTNVKYPGYVAYLIASTTRVVAGLVNSSPQVSTLGCVCRSCNMGNPYASPNRKDGSYVCYNCR